MLMGQDGPTERPQNFHGAGLQICRAAVAVHSTDLLVLPGLSDKNTSTINVSEHPFTAGGERVCRVMQIGH